MKCLNCGQEYKASLKECPYCGYSDVKAKRITKPKKTKKSKLPVVMIIVICLIIAVIGLTFTMIMTGKSNKGTVESTCDVMKITDTTHINNGSSKYHYYSYVKDDQLYLFTYAGLVKYSINDLENNKYTVVYDRDYQNPYIDDENIYYTNYSSVCYQPLNEESDVSMTIINSNKDSFYAKIYDDNILYITGKSGEYTLWQYNRTTETNRKIQKNAYYYYMYDEKNKVVYMIDNDYNLHSINLTSLKDEQIASNVYDLYMYDDVVYVHDSKGVHILGEESKYDEYSYFEDFVVYEGKIVALKDDEIGYVNDDGTLDVFFNEGNIRDMEVQGDVILLRMYDDDYNEYWIAIDDQGNSTIIFNNDNS